MVRIILQLKLEGDFRLLGSKPTRGKAFEGMITGNACELTMEEEVSIGIEMEVLKSRDIEVNLMGRNRKWGLECQQSRKEMNWDEWHDSALKMQETRNLISWGR
jgi:hypothetical protein